jgi:YggT family protein
MALIAALIDFYSLLVLVTVIMSWLPIRRRHPLALMLYRLTEPLLDPIRRMLPPMGGLDLSPMILLIVLQFLKRLITAGSSG